MKKILILLSIFFIIASTLVTYGNTLNSFVDNVGYLTTEEALMVSEKLDSMKNEFNIDFVIHTTQTIGNGDIQDKADLLSEEYNESDGCILLLISAQEREYAYSTYKKAIDIFSSSDLEYIDNQVIQFLKEDNYYEAFNEYADLCREKQEDFLYYENYNPFDAENLIMDIVIGAVPGLIIALILTLVNVFKMKTAIKQNCATDYINEGSFELDNSRDIFLYSNIKRTPKPKENNSTHTSSSGGTHGGRSGSF